MPLWSEKRIRTDVYETQKVDFLLCIEKHNFSSCKYHTYLFHLSLIPETVDERELFSSLGISFGLFSFQCANPLFLSFFCRNYIYLKARGFLLLICSERRRKGMLAELRSDFQRSPQKHQGRRGLGGGRGPWGWWRGKEIPA